MRIIHHPRFEVDGRNLESTLELQAWDAVLGTKAKIETLGGSVIMTIPPNSRTGTRLRLKGRGLPGKTRGDQFVTLSIQVPEHVSAEQRKHFEALAKCAKPLD
jgi:curved DNA-binding protein